MKSPPTRIGSLARAIKLLVALADMPVDTRRPRRLAESARITLPSAYHLLNTFEDAGVLSKDSAGCYQFGPTFGHLAEAYFASDRLPEAVTATVRALAEMTGESAYFSMRRRQKIEMVMYALGSNAVHVAGLPTGFRGVEHARASGKLLLALSDPQLADTILDVDHLGRATDQTITDFTRLTEEFEQVRRQGYATEEDEFIVGVACISAPVFAYGFLYGALTISAPTERYRASKETLARAVCEAAANIQLPAQSYDLRSRHDA